MVPFNEAEYNNVAANLVFWKNVSRGRGDKSDKHAAVTLLGLSTAVVLGEPTRIICLPASADTAA